MRLEIELADSVERSVLRPSENATSALKNRVDNPGTLASYSAKAMSAEKLGLVGALPGGGPYQYVIITNQALASAPGPWNFQALRDTKIARGITATIVTTEWIYANYNGTKPSGGSDNQTRIRNFLIDAYQNWGTEFVLLGGTNAIVPARLFWVNSLAGEVDYMPVDMYYGCVEPPACTFDDDADNLYGEPTDGVGGGDVDLFAEIYVGRATVENATELANFIKKTLAYNSTYSDYLPRVSMLGEYLGFGGVSEYATESMEQIRLGGLYDGYFTYGFENHTQPGFYDFDTSTNLYDSDSYTWPKSELISLMNEGVHIINHLGHADYTYDMKLDTSDLPSLTNDDYFFVYSQGCMPGGFDTTNCFAEVITTVEHGAFAVVMNARYGWGTFNSTDGPSQRFARQFFDAPLNKSEDKLELGKANQDSKEDNLWDIGGGCIRWCYYELNLFGDPQQEMRFEEACEWVTLEPDGGTIAPGESDDISVTFDAMDLIPGLYGAEIIISSNDPCVSAIVPVTMTVSADALQVSPADGFQSSGTKGGPFTPASQIYTLTNSGSGPVSWTTLETEEWLEVTPAGGVLEPGASVDVNVCISASADLLDPNVYSQVLTFQNLDSGSIKPRPISLTVKPPDLFTESFDANGGDFALLSLMFIPNESGAYYEACREKMQEFPTDSNGGTYVALWDDDFAEVILTGGAKVLFYGQWYDRFYIGSNGYITFGQGDVGYSGTLEEHFAMPRISGLFTDLNPPNGQCISYKQLEDRVAVTFEDVPVYDGDKTAKNSFQVEMFFIDGTIRITWLKVAATSGVAGLSEGKGLPPMFFEESDLSKYPVCWLLGDFDRDYTVGLTDLKIFVSHWLDGDCNTPYWCGRTDLDFSGTVQATDFAVFAENWRMTKQWLPGPIAHWKFDEGTGSTAGDSSGNNYNGTITGATWFNDPVHGWCLNFDGSGDWVSIPDTAALNITGDITIAAWVYFAKGGAEQSIVAKTLTSGHTNSPFDFRTNVENPPKLDIVRSDASGHEVVHGTQPVPLNSWHHVLVRVENKVADFYIDGVLTDSYGTLTKTPTVNSKPLYIGRRDDGLYFTGRVNAVRIYDRALSAEEIWQLYEEWLSKKATNPNPADGETGVDPNAVLIWSPGKDAVTHDVYFGMDFNEVNDADIYDANVYMGNQDVNWWDANNYDSNGLEPDTMFYWRIDEISTAGTTKGDVWSFTTWPGELDPNFASWWKFDEGTGTVAYDSAGDNDGSLVNGPVWTTGYIDGGLGFDGVNDYVDVPDDPSLRFTQNSSFSICAWGNPTSAGGNCEILCKMQTIGKYDLFTYELWWNADYQLFEFVICQSGRHFVDVATPTGSAPAGSWSHVVCIYDNRDMKVYLNGELKGSGNFPYETGTNTADKNVGIGARLVGSGIANYFRGTLDDIRIYNRPLSDGEIEQLYQSGL
jgi:hypothetical protein